MGGSRSAWSLLHRPAKSLLNVPAPSSVIGDVLCTGHDVVNQEQQALILYQTSSETFGLSRHSTNPRARAVAHCKASERKKAYRNVGSRAGTGANASHRPSLQVQGTSFMNLPRHCTAVFFSFISAVLRLSCCSCIRPARLMYGAA